MAEKQQIIPVERGFSKHVRLLTAKEYKQVFDKAIRSSDRHFTILARPNTLNYARLGLAITKKKVKLSVDRNRLKRIIRESFRLQNNKFNADYIVLINFYNTEIENKIIFQSINQHWQKLNKKCKEL